jgi:hypothetical protein
MSGQVTAGRGRPQQANPAQIMTASVALSSAQILAADTVPVAVVPAPGPGRTCYILFTFYELAFGTAADCSMAMTPAPRPTMVIIRL